MKTNILSSEAVAEILGKDSLNFLIAFGNDGEVVRFVPDGGCCDNDPLDYSIPEDEIESTQEFKVFTMKEPKMQFAMAAKRCKKYCKYDGQTYCCG